MRSWSSPFAVRRASRPSPAPGGYGAVDPALLDALLKVGQTAVERGAEAAPSLVALAQQRQDRKLAAEQQARQLRHERQMARIQSVQSDYRRRSAPPPARLGAWVYGAVALGGAGALLLLGLALRRPRALPPSPDRTQA